MNMFIYFYTRNRTELLEPDIRHLVSYIYWLIIICFLRIGDTRTTGWARRGAGLRGRGHVHVEHHVGDLAVRRQAGGHDQA